MSTQGHGDHTINNYYTNVSDIHAVDGSQIHAGPQIFRGGDTLRQRRNAIIPQLNRWGYRDAKDRNPEPAPGTCQWALKHSRYTHWRDSDLTSVLLISANPGSGKSVLAKKIVDTEIGEKRSAIVCYFFFKDGFAGQKKLSSALCCLLHQMFVVRMELLSEELCQRFETYGETIYDSTAELWDILVLAASQEDAGQIICILDAFDECLDEDQPKLPKLLERLSEAAGQARLKLLITSRPYEEIRMVFQEIDHLRLGGEDGATLREITAKSRALSYTRLEKSP